MKKFSRVALVAAMAVALVTTATAAFAAQPKVDLLTTAPFAVLAGTGITNVPTSTITGSVGLSPTTGAAITGLTCAEVTGTIYDVNGAFPGTCEVVNPALLTIAKNDLITAYDDAAGRTPVTIVPTELGGTTKTSGVYGSASTTFGITAGAGPLVLDAQGDPNGVFIFEMNSGTTGLVVGPASQVQLTGGAQACNVFWRLNTATIGTTATFKGTILALTSITVGNGANIEGRLLARNGNVTLVGDTITVPTCTTTTTTDTDTGTDATPGLPGTGSDAAANLTVPALVTTIIFSLYWAIRKRIA